MNVSTVEQSAIIQKTLSTDGASGASSVIQMRIDKHIEAIFAEASSENFLKMKSSASQAIAHGFTSCANLRYVGLLEDCQDSPLRSHYAEHYPQCCFLTWKTLRLILRGMRLWLELPQHYVGAIPPEQLPWLDVFSMRSEDVPIATELAELVSDDKIEIERLKILFDSSPFRPGAYRVDFSLFSTIRSFADQFQNSWFVVAPPDAFNSSEDFISRVRKMIRSAEAKVTIPSDDPLVIRFVKGGCLVVAAWGEEAATINAVVRKIENPV